MEIYYLLIIAIPIAGILLYAGFDFYSIRRRSAAIKRWAEQKGLAFCPTKENSFLDQLSWVQLFSKGHIKKIKNLIRGEMDEMEFSIFDYEYTVLSKRSDMRSSVNTVFLVHLPKIGLPVFSLWPRSLYRKVAGKQGAQELSFEGREACFQSDLPFSKNYLLYGKDEAALRRIFSDRLLGWLGEHRGLRIEGADQRLIMYFPGKRVKAKALPTFP
jgi:hypothetical protein